MKTLAITVKNKRQEQLFTNLAGELGIEITEASFKPLTTKDVVLGIGRKFSDEELNEYVTRTPKGKAKDVDTIKSDIKKRLSKKSTRK